MESAFIHASHKKANKDHLWVWSDTLKKCDTHHIVLILRRVIEAADSGKLPQAHEIRRMGATLAFLRIHSLEQVLEADEWASASSFAVIYLTLTVRDTPYVAMGSLWMGDADCSSSFIGLSFERCE